MVATGTLAAVEMATEWWTTDPWVQTASMVFLPKADAAVLVDYIIQFLKVPEFTDTILAAKFQYQVNTIKAECSSLEQHHKRSSLERPHILRHLLPRRVLVLDLPTVAQTTSRVEANQHLLKLVLVHR